MISGKIYPSNIKPTISPLHKANSFKLISEISPTIDVNCLSIHIDELSIGDILNESILIQPLGIKVDSKILVCSILTTLL